MIRRKEKKGCSKKCFEKNHLLEEENSRLKEKIKILENRIHSLSGLESDPSDGTLSSVVSGPLNISPRNPQEDFIMFTPSDGWEPS